MHAIRKVVLAGASGNLGPEVLDQLRRIFEVTVLTRQDTAHNFPPSVKVRKVDYSSVDSLVTVLRGHDAVVSTLATLAFDRQLLLIDAAVTAGIRRFIPSEFGSDTTSPRAVTLPILKHKVLTQEVLQQKAAASTGFSYTIICTGPFLDWGITKGFMNIKEKRVHLYNGGDVVYSTTTLPTIAKAICGVLTHPEETSNRVVRLQDTETTQNKLLEMAKKVVGPEGWKIEQASTDTLLDEAWDEFRQGKTDLSTMWKFIPAATWGDGFEGHFAQTDNELLGITEMSETELQAVIHRLAES